jgi:hypothetical protein
MTDDEWLDHAGSPEDEAERQALMAQHRAAVEASRDETDGPSWGIGANVTEPIWSPDTPPAQLLYLVRTEARSGAPGVIELGTAGFLVGEGGIGKGFAALDLALAVAASGPGGNVPWLGAGGLHVNEPGHVLFLTAEDRERHIRRRLFDLAAARRLSDEARARALRRLHVVCTKDRPELRTMRLQDDEGPASLAAIRLRAELRAAANARLEEQGGDPTKTDGSVPWRLIIIDTLSRTAAADAETDPHIASRYTAILESLTDCNPEGCQPATVIAIHHTGKGKGRSDGARAARGSSALTDDARWVGVLTYPDDHYKHDDLDPWRWFKVAKVNHGPPIPAMALHQGDGGVLEARPASVLRALEASTKQNSKARAKNTKPAPGKKGAP